jgi:two-component system, LuxR family, response regulator FixJ
MAFGGKEQPMRPNSNVVLLVDDDAAVRNSLKFALETEGLHVRVYDGPTALLGDIDHLRGCLVVDYRMPGMDGLELVDQLRQQGVQLPTIMITGRANKELRRQAASAGIRQLLEKPLSDGALRDAIRSALGA